MQEQNPGLAQEDIASTEGATFEYGTDDVGTLSAEDVAPVPINVQVGQNVSVAGVVTAVEEDAVTIQIEDGLIDNIHRITLNSRQASVAVK